MPWTGQLLSVFQLARSVCQNQPRWGQTVPCGLLILITVAFVPGCRQIFVRPSAIVACPLSSAEQVARLLELAPLGLPREEALQKLTAAGIQWTFGENQSICYCDLWKQDGEVWHINVVLLFDEAGKLYRTRPEAVGIAKDSPGTGSNASAREAAVVDQERGPAQSRT